jgi:hypothetical protein
MRILSWIVQPSARRRASKRPEAWMIEPEGLRSVLMHTSQIVQTDLPRRLRQMRG